MSVVTLPKAGITPIGYVNIDGVQAPVYLDQEWARGFDQLLNRTGGVTSNTITEINIAAFEDAGIPEQQAEINSLAHQFGQSPMPAENIPVATFEGEGLAALRERVAVLESTITALMQGTTP